MTDNSFLHDFSMPYYKYFGGESWYCKNKKNKKIDADPELFLFPCWQKYLDC